MTRLFRRRPRLALGVSALAAVSMLSSCGATPSATTQPPALLPPLNAVTETTGGVFASIAMGDTSQFVNTFWQELERPTGRGPWRLVTPPGIATNGGVITASGTQGRLVVGIGASLGLTFSAIESSTDLGDTWATGVLPVGLIAEPGAIASGSGTRLLALVERGKGAVDESSGGLSAWTTFASWHTLEVAAKGGGCDLRALTALAVVGDATFVGASCSSSGSSHPLLERVDGVWRSVGPSVGGVASVVARLTVTETGIAALMVSDRHGVSTFVVASKGSAASSWVTGGALTVVNATLAATATTTWGQFAIALRRGAGCTGYLLAPGNALDVAVLDDGTLPDGACVFAPGPGNGDEALRVAGSNLSVFTQSNPRGRWRLTQHRHVPIQYGSSQ